MSISKEEINNILEESNNFQYVELNEKNLDELITIINKNYDKNIDLRKNLIIIWIIFKLKNN